MFQTALYKGSSFSESLSTLDFLSHFDFSYSSECVVVFHCGLICLSLMTNDVEHVFRNLFISQISSLLKGSIKIFSPF